MSNKQFNKPNPPHPFGIRKYLTLSLSALAIMGFTACSKKTDDGAVTADRFEVYVSQQEGPLLVLNGKDYRKKAEILIGGIERGLGVTNDGKYLVVAVKNSRELHVIDLKTRKIIHRVEVGINPEFVRVKEGLAFVAYEPSSKGPPPKPGQARPAEANDDEDEEEKIPAKVAIIDIATGKKLREITAGSETEGIEFSADGTQIIVTNEGDENLSVHDIASGQLIKTIDTKDYGIRPRGIKRSPDGENFAVTMEFSNKIIILNRAYEVTHEIPTGETPYGITYDRSGELLYVAMARGKTMQVFSTKTHEMVKEFPIGERCWHFTFTPDDSQLIVACGRSHEILIIDPATGETIKRIGDLKLPWGVVTSPRAVGSLSEP